MEYFNTMDHKSYIKYEHGFPEGELDQHRVRI